MESSRVIRDFSEMSKVFTASHHTIQHPNIADEVRHVEHIQTYIDICKGYTKVASGEWKAFIKQAETLGS